MNPLVTRLFHVLHGGRGPVWWGGGKAEYRMREGLGEIRGEENERERVRLRERDLRQGNFWQSSMNSLYLVRSLDCRSRFVKQNHIVQPLVITLEQPSRHH